MSKLTDRNLLNRVRIYLDAIYGDLTRGTRMVLDYAEKPDSVEFRKGISYLIGTYELIREREGEIIAGLYLAEDLLKMERENKKTKTI